MLAQQNNLGVSLRKAGKLDLAEPYARACAENTPAVFAVPHPLVAHLRNNLALTLLMLRRDAEADTLLAETWHTATEHYAIVTPAIAFLSLLAAFLTHRDPADPLGRLKTILLGPALPSPESVAHPWDVGYMLDYLHEVLTEEQRDLLASLLAAINDPEQTAVLDQFPLWRDTPAVPLETPWPGDDGHAVR